MKDTRIKQLAKEVEEYAVTCRRRLHQLPEIGGKEYLTSRFICDELEKMRVDIIKVGETGLIGIVKTGKEGPHVVLRADMDALMIEESPFNKKNRKVCVSENAGVSHACGHDAHVAILLAALKVLADKRNEFSGTVYACFEAGEENAYGYREMLSVLQKYPIDTCWAIHVYNELESGKICVDYGARMAGISLIDMIIKGESTHGASGKMRANAIFTAGYFLKKLSEEWNKDVALGITQIQGGNSYNIIPDNVRICGSIRYFDKLEGENAIRFFKKSAVDIAIENECEVIFDKKMEDSWSPVLNDFKYTELIRSRMSQAWGSEVLVSIEPWSASESFSHYSQKYPSVFVHLGIKNEKLGTGAPHHSPQFDIDENVLVLGVESTLLYVDEVCKHCGS